MHYPTSLAVTRHGPDKSVEQSETERAMDQIYNCRLTSMITAITAKVVIRIAPSIIIVMGRYANFQTLAFPRLWRLPAGLCAGRT